MSAKASVLGQLKARDDPQLSLFYWSLEGTNARLISRPLGSPASRMPRQVVFVFVFFFFFKHDSQSDFCLVGSEVSLVAFRGVLFQTWSECGGKEQFEGGDSWASPTHPSTRIMPEMLVSSAGEGRITGPGAHYLQCWHIMVSLSWSHSGVT